MNEASLKTKIKQTLSGWDDLLDNQDDLWPLTHPLAGHCYCASEALYTLTGEDERWDVKRMIVSVQVPEPLSGEAEYTHWFLKDKQTNEIVDLTAEQFTTYSGFEKPLSYESAESLSFKNPSPSPKTKQLLDKL